MNLSNTVLCGGVTKRQSWMNGRMEYYFPIGRSIDRHIVDTNRCQGENLE